MRKAPIKEPRKQPGENGMLYASCRACGDVWNVSAISPIGFDSDGEYVCPRCEFRETRFNRCRIRR
jgi:hypothetical protein